MNQLRRQSLKGLAAAAAAAGSTYLPWHSLVAGGTCRGAADFGIWLWPIVALPVLQLLLLAWGRRGRGGIWLGASTGILGLVSLVAAAVVAMFAHGKAASHMHIGSFIGPLAILVAAGFGGAEALTAWAPEKREP